MCGVAAFRHVWMCWAVVNRAQCVRIVRRVFLCCRRASMSRECLHIVCDDLMCATKCGTVMAMLGVGLVCHVSVLPARRSGGLLSQKNWAPLTASTRVHPGGSPHTPHTPISVRTRRPVFVTRVVPLMLCALDLDTRLCTAVVSAPDMAADTAMQAPHVQVRGCAGTRALRPCTKTPRATGPCAQHASA